jgi:signal transduction histidine kinase
MSTGSSLRSLQARVADRVHGHLDVVSFGIVSVLISLTAMTWLPASLLTVLASIIAMLATVAWTAWQAGLAPAMIAAALTAAALGYSLAHTAGRIGAAAEEIATLAALVLVTMIAIVLVVHRQRQHWRSDRLAHERLHTLYSHSVRLWDEPSLDLVLEKALLVSRAFLKTRHAAIYVCDAHDGTLEAITHSGVPADLLSTSVDSPADHPAAAACSGKLIVAQDIAQQFPALASLCRWHGITGAQCTPLFNFDGSVLGVMAAYTSEGASPSGHELTLWDLYARQVGRVMRTKLYEHALLHRNASLVEKEASTQTEVSERDHLLRGLVGELALTEARERRRLATELHDHLAQLLVLARMKLSRIRAHSSADATKSLEETHELVTLSLNYTRGLIAEWWDAELRKSGLPASLRRLGAQMAMHNLTVQVEGSDTVALSEEHALLLYQSIRELLFNIIKHAGVDRATVAVVPDHDSLVVTVQDQGQGFDASNTPTHVDGAHFGLASIRERMVLMNGAFHVQSQPGHGTTVTLRVPIQPAHDTPASVVTSLG